ncbi:MAG TPA: class I SAM-dependent methyltransferase, partial [Candidatus Saccharimonadales bacterium]|nr:class I SAM-dependent methyltransferase [Candidatus Saccharimonadales bacterium]
MNGGRMSHYTNNLFDAKSKNNSWVHLFDFVPKDSRVLDVGCSSGNFGEVLINEKQCEVVGLDIDVPDIAEAGKKLTAAYVRNIEQEDIADLGTFDVVMFVDVLEHLLDPIAALEKVKKQLKKGGRVAFSIPNMAHISVRLQLLEGFFEYTPIGVLDRTHLHYYDELEVKQIFNQSGFAIKEINPTTWTYPISVLSERFLQMGL